jgi:hypothetical protein
MSVDIKPFRTMRQGIEMDFRGFEPDESGEPNGEPIDVTLTVPPLNFDSLQLLEGKLGSLGQGSQGASMQTIAVAIGHALKRNYRGVPEWLIRQTLDIANLGEFTQALMDVSGLRRKELEAGKAQATGSPLTGTASTAT